MVNKFLSLVFLLILGSATWNVSAASKMVSRTTNAETTSTYDTSTPLITSADQISSNNCSVGDGSSYANLIDNDKSTIFHSIWSTTMQQTNLSESTWAEEMASANFATGTGYHNLQIKLNSPISRFVFTYIGRNSDWHDNPNDIQIYATNDDNLGASVLASESASWTLITELKSGFPDDIASAEYTSPCVDLGASYKYIRFVIKNTTHNGKVESRVFNTPDVTGITWNVSEFQMYEVSQQTLTDSLSNLITTAETLHQTIYGTKGLITSSSQISSNAQSAGDGSSYANLIDNNTETIFHSTWDTSFKTALTTGTGWHNLQFTLPAAISKMNFTFTGRNSTTWADTPNHITIYGTNDATLGASTAAADSSSWKEITDLTNGFPDNVALAKYASPDIDLGASYKYLRFVVKHTTNEFQQSERTFAVPAITGVTFNLSEMQIYDANPSTDSQYNTITGMKDACDAMDAQITSSKTKITSNTAAQSDIDALQKTIDSVNKLLETAVLSNYKQLTNLQSMYIETFDGADITSKDVYKLCRIYLVSDTGTVKFDSVSIRGRGNASWNFAKKPYRIKFPDKVKLLGKGFANAKNWVLLSNGLEKLLFRNGLTQYVGGLFGMEFTPACRFIDFYLNGNYRGTYQITDQVEIHKKRIDIDEQDTVVTDPNTDISGGYFLEVDGYTDAENYFHSSMGTNIRVHSPEPGIASSDQLAYIKNHVNKFEAALQSTNYTDPNEGYKQYMDTTTFLGWYLTSEIGTNGDTFWSIYFYKKKADDHLYFGPLWDFDLGYNNDSRRGDLTYQLIANVNFDSGYFKNWFDRIATDNWFKEATYRHFHALYANGRLDSLMLHYVDSVYAQINASQEQNYKIWSISAQTHLETHLFNTYQEYIDDIKTYIVEHNKYMDQQFSLRCPIQFKVNDQYYYRIMNKGFPTYLLGLTDSTVDVANTALRAEDDTQLAQQWEFKSVGKYYMLINARTGKAITDAGTSSKTLLTVETADSTNQSQLWDLVSRGDKYFNIKNVYNSHVITNYNSLNKDLNPINGYTSSTQDVNDNRIWFGVPVLKIENTPSAISLAQAGIDYGLDYNPQSKQLHFVAENLSELVFKASIYDLNGICQGTFRGDETFDAGNLPNGTYIVSWQFAGKSHSTKFLKN